MMHNFFFFYFLLSLTKISSRLHHCTCLQESLQTGRLIVILFAQIDKYLKILCVRMHISNTNEYFFLILCKSINYYPLMNPVKFRQDKIQNGRLIAIFFAQIAKIFENFVLLDDYLQHQWIIVSDTLHMHLLQTSHESL